MCGRWEPVTVLGGSGRKRCSTLVANRTQLRDNYKLSDAAELSIRVYTIQGRDYDSEY
jgi:hypothetical protein